MNLAWSIRSLKDIQQFTDETMDLHRTGQLSESNLKARKEWIQYFLLELKDMNNSLTEAQRELEGIKNEIPCG